MTTSGPQSSGGDPSRDPGSTSLPAAGRVSRFLLPGVGWVVMTPGGSGQPWPMSSPSCGPPSSSVRTSSVTGPVSSELSWPTLHRLATKPGPALSALARWAPHTHGPGCSSWPTPKASDAGRGSRPPAEGAGAGPGSPAPRRYRASRRADEHRPEYPRRDRWPAEPGVDRVAHGVPGRVDRLRALGNAVVPAVAEYVGRIITEDRGSA